MNAFTPQSPLEQALLDAQEDRLSQDAFLEKFINTPVVFLADHPVSESGEWHPETKPLVLGTPKGWPALAVFSHPDRAQALPEHLRVGRAHALVAVAGAVIQGIGPDLGLVMNPGSPVGFEIPPAQLAALKAAFGMGPEPTGA